ncbi:unnamed protein product, partial [Polarella glacialis]
AGSFGVSLEQCHQLIDDATAEWQSKELLEKTLALARDRKAGTGLARGLVKETSAEMNRLHGARLGFGGEEQVEVVSAKLAQVISHYSQADRSLPAKTDKLQESVMRFAGRLSDELRRFGDQGNSAGYPKAAEKDVEVLVHIDRTLGLKSTIRIARSATVQAIARPRKLGFCLLVCLFGCCCCCRCC